jgi:hypothetical protein
MDDYMQRIITPTPSFLKVISKILNTQNNLFIDLYVNIYFVFEYFMLFAFVYVKTMLVYRTLCVYYSYSIKFDKYGLLVITDFFQGH